MELLVRCDWGLRLYPKAFLIKKVWFEVHESIINLKDFDLLLQERLSAEAERMRYVSLHDVVLDMARWIASKENSGLKILFLDNYDSKTPIARLDLKVLYIRRASGSSNLFSLNVLSSLRDLRVLQVEEFIEVMAISTLTKLKGVEFLVCVVTPYLDFLEGFVFPRLLGYDIAINIMLTRYIKIRCSRLLTFTVGFLLKNVQVAMILQNLRSVLIEDCKSLKLKCLFSSCLAQSLVYLEALVIRHYEELEEIIGDMEVHKDIFSNITTESSLCLPSLKTLKIEGCPRIEIRGCLQLAQVFNGDNGVVHRISQSGLRVVDYPRLRIKRSEFN
ncbi:hypothetical protein Godav_009851 [Gossypium davidsonii]|uniref:Uncharacterized protein n=1 Tax=Gossypium davidsonii TaxID=34287 RepID=A0A7J8SEK2_GOSDV|nr:hypothetical protein [Gossypium davidsonii]